jgi:hypothetical protein
MKFNFAVFGATLAGTCVAGVVAIAPAEAAIVGGSAFGGSFSVSESGGTTEFTDFSTAVPILTNGVMSVFDTVEVNSLTIKDSGDDLGSTGVVFDIYDFVNADRPWKVYSTGGDLTGLTASFFIKSGQWGREKGLSGSELNYAQFGDFTGIYKFSDGRKFNGSGQLDLERGQSGLTAFAMTQDVAPIPTPALLPGLLGMGAAAFRKRKREAAKL